MPSGVASPEQTSASLSRPCRCRLAVFFGHGIQVRVLVLLWRSSSLFRCAPSSPPKWMKLLPPRQMAGPLHARWAISGGNIPRYYCCNGLWSGARAARILRVPNVIMDIKRSDCMHNHYKLTMYSASRSRATFVEITNNIDWRSRTRRMHTCARLGEELYDAAPPASLTCRPRMPFAMRRARVCSTWRGAAWASTRKAIKIRSGHQMRACPLGPALTCQTNSSSSHRLDAARLLRH